jgi:uncharacterized protein (DUF58 family)
VNDAWLKAWSWHNLRIASGVQERLRRRFTHAGQAVLATTLCAGLFGLDTRMTAAYQLFALGAALLLVAAIGTLRQGRGLNSERKLPRHATVGEPCRYLVRLHHTGGRPLTGLELAERLPDPRPDRATFLAARAPIEARLNRLERLFGYPRWEWLVRQGRRAEPQKPFRCRPSPPVKVSKPHCASPRPAAAGCGSSALVAAQTDVLGLMRRETPVSGNARVLVLPRRYPVPPLPRPGHRRLQPGGVNLASAVGDSREFMGLRDYLPGDSPRHIHWAAWARSGEPVVKEYQDEFFSRQALILDSFTDANDQRTDAEANFECAISIAASLIEPLNRAGAGQDALLDLMFVAERAHAVTGGRGLFSTAGMLEVLACLEPKRGGNFSSLSELVLGQAPRLSAAICVLLAWDRPRRELVRRLRAMGLPLQVLLISEQALADASAALIQVDPKHPEPALARLGGI